VDCTELSGCMKAKLEGRAFFLHLQLRYTPKPSRSYRPLCYPQPPSRPPTATSSMPLGWGGHGPMGAEGCVARGQWVTRT
jgi:hypothetical protein